MESTQRARQLLHVLPRTTPGMQPRRHLLYPPVFQPCMVRSVSCVGWRHRASCSQVAGTLLSRPPPPKHTHTDNLVLGRSTFAEELCDASYILCHATPASLVVMDELGRGTATCDGVAIATATLHHLLHASRALTLFITHYPEVAQLAAR